MFERLFEQEKYVNVVRQLEYYGFFKIIQIDYAEMMGFLLFPAPYSVVITTWSSRIKSCR